MNSLMVCPNPILYYNNSTIDDKIYDKKYMKHISVISFVILHPDLFIIFVYIMLLTHQTNWILMLTQFFYTQSIQFGQLIRFIPIFFDDRLFSIFIRFLSIEHFIGISFELILKEKSALNRMQIFLFIFDFLIGFPYTWIKLTQNVIAQNIRIFFFLQHWYNLI